MTNYFGVSDELLTDDGFLLLGSKTKVEQAVKLLKTFEKSKKAPIYFDKKSIKRKITELCIEDMTNWVHSLASSKIIIEFLRDFPDYPPFILFEHILVKEAQLKHFEGRFAPLKLTKTSFMESRFYIESLERFCNTQNNSSKPKRNSPSPKTIKKTKIYPQQLHESYCQWMTNNTNIPPLTYETCEKIQEIYAPFDKRDPLNKESLDKIERLKEKDKYYIEFYKN